MGPLVSLTYRCWIPYTTRDLVLSWSISNLSCRELADEPSLGTRRAKLSLQYATKIKLFPKHPSHNSVFDNKYLKFDARHTFGLHIKQFLTASIIVF